MYYSDFVRISKTGIDLKTTGAVTIFTTENGTQRFVPTAIIVEITAAVSITVGATISAGITAASYNDIMAATVLTGVTAVNNMLAFPALASAVVTSVPANTAFKINVTVAATGTSQSARVDVIGYYV